MEFEEGVNAKTPEFKDAKIHSIVLDAFALHIPMGRAVAGRRLENGAVSMRSVPVEWKRFCTDGKGRACYEMPIGCWINDHGGSRPTENYK